MSEPLKLTKKQTLRLRGIGDATLTDAVAWWGNSTDASLLRRGLVERCDETQKLSAAVSFTTHLCRLTAAGRAALLHEGQG